MSNLSQFVFQNNQVRVFMIDGQPWFTAKDVALILEYVKTDKMLQLVDEEDKQTINPQNLDNPKMEETFNSNTFRVSLLNESGLYAVIFGSTKPEAKAFKRWVTSEVLPQIRRTGKFEAQPKIENIYAHRVQIASQWDIPKGYWCVFHEISLLANKVGLEYPVAQYDLIDGSVGIRWANYRKGFDWTHPTIKFPILFGDKRDTADITALGYDNKELYYFRDWLERIYTYKCLPQYLSGKYPETFKKLSPQLSLNFDNLIS